MRLSSLQKYILLTSYGSPSTPAASGGLRSGGKRISRTVFHKFYEGKVMKQKAVVDVITKTLERLIDKGLMVGLGVRTPKKWYLREVRLTPLGRRVARQMRKAKQPRLFSQFPRDS